MLRFMSGWHSSLRNRIVIVLVPLVLAGCGVGTASPSTAPSPAVVATSTAGSVPPTPTAIGVPTAPSPAVVATSTAGSVPPTPTAIGVPTNTVGIRVNAGVTHQTMLGFGVSHEAIPTLGNMRAAAIDAVYGQVHLTTGNIDANLLESPSDFNSVANDDADPFHFNWAGFQHGGVDTAKTLLIDLALPFGFTDFYPGQRLNTRYASPWMGALRATNYNRYLDEAAEQVAAGLIYWRNTYGIVKDYEELFNEPLSGNGELAYGATTQDLIDLVKRVGSRLRREGFANVKFVIPNEETEEQSLRDAAAILADPEARQYVGAIGYHPYPYPSVYANIPNLLATSGSGKPVASRIAVRNQLRDLGKQYNIPLWMTEVCCGGVGALSYDGFRGRAIHIHDELLYADASAYYALTNIGDSNGGHGGVNVYSIEGPAVIAENATGIVSITGMGRAIGHYARWIRKGAIRLDAASSDPLVQVSAFRDGQNRLTFVVINNADSARTISLGLAGVAFGGSIGGEQSISATSYWQPLAVFAPVDSTHFNATLPPFSVTTYVVQAS